MCLFYFATSLLNGSFQIPVKIHITVAPSVYKAQESIVVLVQLMTNPSNPSPASGESFKESCNHREILGSVFAWIPQPLGPPNHVRPRPQFSRKQNRLKWSFQDLQPNKNALFKFVFTKKESMLNQEELAKSIRVEMNAIGTPGINQKNKITQNCIFVCRFDVHRFVIVSGIDSNEQQPFTDTFGLCLDCFS